MKETEKRFECTGVGVFTTQTTDKRAAVHLRYFAPSIGIEEDAAAGSAAGGLGALLAKAGILDSDLLTEFVVEQGLELKRPSQLYVSVTMNRGMPIQVKVGGYCVDVISGRLGVP